MFSFAPFAVLFPVVFGQWTSSVSFCGFFVRSLFGDLSPLLGLFSSHGIWVWPFVVLVPIYRLGLGFVAMGELSVHNRLPLLLPCALFLLA
jgi:hypothetical protein